MTGVLLWLVVLLLVGLPLLALAAGRWLPMPRGRPGPTDPALKIARAHGVGGMDAIRMQEAVERGEQVVPALRPAVVAWAEHVLTERTIRRGALRSRRYRVGLVALGVAAGCGLVVAVARALDGDLGNLVGVAVQVVLVSVVNAVWIRRRRARARAAIAANREA